MSLFKKIFGSEEHQIAKYRENIIEINKLEPQFERFSNDELKAKTEEFKKRLAEGTALDDILPEAFALIREAGKRTIGQRHFDSQLIGGMVLHDGKIAQMATGEGKTLSATAAVYLNALEGKGVHLITVNDYLSKRDANWMGPIYHSLGLSVSCLQHEASFLFDPRTAPDKNEVTVEMENLRPVPRREAYAADITYGTNNEFGFDYLRDNMVQDVSQMSQRGHNFAIVDEVDSILIDEARTPLIISAPDEESGKMYQQFAQVVPRLKENEDYIKDEKMRVATLTEDGISNVEKILGIENIYAEGGVRLVHHLEQALRAQTLFERDRHYIVKEGEVIIVDEFTGRLMPGRRYSDGLHQALEAKENVLVQKESRTLATITFQNYFRMYQKLSGMTGTALPSAEEFHKVYKLEVVPVPTNKPLVRQDLSDAIFKTEKGKFQALIRQLKECQQKGQPVLVGTVSIDKNEYLSVLMRQEGIKHEILNAKNHEREAQIIAQAGMPSAVTIATNMAGRGVDIILGGRPDQNASWQSDHEKVVNAGGLYVIGTERHEARRIDDQLRGRSGRQGDPGTTQFFVSLEDDLMRIFGSDRIKTMLDALKVPEDQPIENRLISRAIESAQAKIEGFNFDTRKHVLEYDDVMNRQRETIYKKRLEILEAKINLKDKVMEIVFEEVEKIVQVHTAGRPDEWNKKEIIESCLTIFPMSMEIQTQVNSAESPEKIIEILEDTAKTAYDAREKELGQDVAQQIEKAVMLRALDMLWMDHLDEMEHLRDSVKLRAYGQKDPLVEYKNEGHKIFQQLLVSIQSNIVSVIYKVGVMKEPQVPQRIIETGPAKNASGSQRVTPKPNVGRNDPCPCGSGKKYKKCHGK